jgi:hypothetical protein
MRFIKSSLKDLGLTYQLNHHNLQCPTPIACHENFGILHTNGIHEVAVRFCGCTRQIPRHLQLLRRGMYPASQIDVRTVATFRLLQLLHLLSLTAMSSVHDQYRTIERLTSNIGFDVPKSRSRALFRMTVQWRHLKLAKRAGRGHDSTGIKGTRNGELSILCPTCPYVGINTPEETCDVENSSEKQASFSCSLE